MPDSPDSQRFQRIEELFNRTLELTQAEREAFLRAECGDDKTLLADLHDLIAADEAPTFTVLEETAELASSLALPPGTQIGPFQIVRQLGEGGMGTVYEATQKRPQRTVALKTLRAGADSPKARRRFEYESDILGRMQHPGIAQIFEAGTYRTGQREVPFLAMELLADASALDDYVERRASGLNETLRLFVDVCDAVQHAHQHGVLHRDLKPSNLLVDKEGRVKVIDFGIAMAIDTEEIRRTLRTETGIILGTLAYMSPEQLEQDASPPDARTDVYSLGVLLFQLLTGKLPHKLDTLPVATALNVIHTRDMPHLEAYGLRDGTTPPRELDWILQKATEREVELRYQSVTELAADVRRFLEEKPLEIGPPSTAYRLRKFVRRHRAIAYGGALALFALMTGTVATSIGWHHAVHAEEVADHKRRELEQVTLGFWQATQISQRIDSIVSNGIQPEMLGQLDAATTRLDDHPLEDRAIEAALRAKIARAFEEFGEHAKATAQFAKAIELTEDDNHLPEVRIEALTTYGTALTTSGKIEEGIVMLQEAIALAEEHANAFTLPPATPRSRLAYAYSQLGRYAEARDTYGEAIEGLAARPDGETWTRLKLQLLLGRGNAERALGNYEASMADLEAGLRFSEQKFGMQDRRTLGARADLAILLLQDKERAPEAEALLRDVTNSRTELLGTAHTSTISTVLNLAFALHRQKKFAESEELCTKHLEAARAAGVANRMPMLKLRFNLGVAQMKRAPGGLAAAEATFRSLVRDGAETLPTNHWMMLAFQARVGMCRWHTANADEQDPTAQRRCLAEARAELEPAVAGLQKALGIKNRQTVEAASALAHVLSEQGDAEAAAKLVEQFGIELENKQ